MGGFLGAITGSNQRKAIRQGQQQAIGAIDAGETAAVGEYDSAIGLLDPYAEGGQEGLEAYLASLGLRGEDARRLIQDTYFNDPVQNRLMDRVTRANTRQFTGSGMGNSGPATQALSNRLLEMYSGYQDRLKGLGDTGMQATGLKSTLTAGKGDIRFGAAQQRAGTHISSANAIAGAHSLGANNLTNLIGTAVRAISSFGMPGGGGPKIA